MPKVLQLGGGRPRKPTSQKALAGTLKKGRINASEPGGEAVLLPEPPETLGEDERTAWVELKALIDPMRVATAADVFAFRAMVEDAGMLASLRRSYRLPITLPSRVEGIPPEEIAPGGVPVYVESTKAGPQLRMRPEIQAIPTYRKLLLLHMARWGIDPADRSRVSALADDAPKRDPLAKFRIGARR